MYVLFCHMHFKIGNENSEHKYLLVSPDVCLDFLDKKCEIHIFDTN